MVRRCRRWPYQVHGARWRRAARFPACHQRPDRDLTAALHAAQHGDEAGFVAIYRDVQPRLLRYATVLVGRDAAEDVTAEAWLQISRDLHKFAGDIDRFRGWAATIVHHRAMDVCRAGARRPTTALPDDERDEPVGASDTAASRSTRCPPTWRSR